LLLIQETEAMRVSSTVLVIAAAAMALQVGSGGCSGDTSESDCSEVTGCIDDDGCCPSGCAFDTDSDCTDPCLGVTECVDGDGCCPSGCAFDTDNDCADPCLGVSGCIDDDGCCPSGCNSTNDNDCVGTDNCSAENMDIVGLGIDGVSYDIARDNQDGVHIIWLTGNVLHYGRIENGIVEGQETAWDGSQGGIHTRWTRPRLSVQPDAGTVHTSFIQNGNQNLYHVWRNKNGQWRNEEVWGLSGMRPHMVGFPVVGADSSGIIHLVAQQWWVDDQTGDELSEVVYARKDGNWTWATLEVGAWRQTSMFIDRSGGVHATWKWFTKPGHYRYVPSGGSLLDASSIDIPKAGGSHSMGDSFVEQNGAVHHAFATFHGTNPPDIDYALKPAGSGSFGALSSPSDGEIEMCSLEHPWPAVAAFDGGRVLVAWGEEPCSTTGIMSKLMLAWKDPEESNWHSAALDEAADIDPESKPAMTITGRGVYLVWRAHDGSLMLARCGG